MDYSEWTTDELFNNVITLGEEKECVIYNINNRMAGWGILWFDETRCETPEPNSKKHYSHGGDGMEALSRQMTYERKAQQARMNEGLVVHAYYSSFREMLEGEMDRLNSKEETQDGKVK